MKLRNQLDLMAPAGEDEVIYTPLQLSRYDRFMDRQLRGVRRWILTALAIMLAAVAISSWVQFQSDAKRVQSQCVTTNNARQSIKDAFAKLVDVFDQLTPADQAEALEAFRVSLFDGPKGLDRNLKARDC